MVKKEPNVQFKGRNIGQGEAGQDGAGHYTYRAEFRGNHWEG